jgi:hypothetical protein
MQMKIYLAAYDPGVERDSGNYWAWAHPIFSRQLLDRLYYEFIVFRKPEDPNTLGREDVVGGCAKLDDTWCCWYRFFNGDCDSHGRPGRFVVIAALLRLSELANRDWSQFLMSPLMSELESHASTCPMPPPTSLEITWDRHAIPPTDDLRIHLNGKKEVSLSSNEVGPAIGLVTGEPNVRQFHLQIDWVKEKERTQLSLDQPMFFITDDVESRLTAPEMIARPGKNQPSLSQETLDNTNTLTVDTGPEKPKSRWKDFTIILLALAVVMLSALLAFVLLQLKQPVPLVPTTVPTTPTEPFAPRTEKKPPKVKASISLKD